MLTMQADWHFENANFVLWMPRLVDNGIYKMLGIMAFFMLGAGFAFLLPDNDVILNTEDDLDPGSEGLLLESSDSVDLLEELGDLFPDISLEPDGEIKAGDHLAADDGTALIDENEGDSSVGDEGKNDIPHSPYRNEFDLTSFEEVVFSDGSGNDISGGAFDDLLVGGGGADLMDGGDGDDYLFGGNGSDTMSGGSGNDLVVACMDPYLADSAGGSELYGGEGDDTLIGESGDYLEGGFGIDEFHVFASGDGDEIAAHISDFDASKESLLIEIRDGNMGGEIDYEIQEAENGLKVLIGDVTVVFLEGVDLNSNIHVIARSASY